MPCWARAGVLLAVVSFLAASPAAEAATRPCKADDGRQCLTLTVPLDRSGAMPGTVRLRVEVRRARRPKLPPLLMLAGAPGYSSRIAALDTPTDLLRGEAPARDIVIMDLRGTGRSGALRCPSLEHAGRGQVAEAVAECAASLGARRGFYTARDSADDIEAVRQVLGVERIALLGGSYGAQVAFTYAQRYPSRVDRLALDSIAGPQGFDGLYRPGFAAVPEAIQVLCRKNRCQHASKDPLDDFTALAERLERRSLTGTVLGRTGRPHRAHLNAFDLFELLLQALDGDREIVGLVHNARRGDLRPLLRHWRRLRSGGADAFRVRWLNLFSPAAHAASRCEDSVLPWSRTASLGERRSQAEAFVRGLPAGSLAPFGTRAALGSDVLELCRLWPIASPALESPKALPAIPALIVTSVDDVLAPVSAARAVANLIPGSRLLRLRGAGHDIFASGGSGCAEQVLQEFLSGSRPTDVCGPEWKSYRGASKPPPLSLGEVDPDPRVDGHAGRALRAVNATIRDGAEFLEDRFLLLIFHINLNRQQSWREALSSPIRVGGLRRGSYVLAPESARLTLRGASYVPGVRVSGWMILAQNRSARRGVIRVWGPETPDGKLVIRRGMLSGRLGDRRVSAPVRIGPDLGFVVRPSATGDRLRATASSSREEHLERLFSGLR
jgi:pimeloyl-ACP methyl ester carboxylesterase